MGTNDLTQYVMAADRMLGSLADLNTPWQPAVLRLLKIACDGAAASEKKSPVGVCGEAAADPALAVVLDRFTWQVGPMLEIGISFLAVGVSGFFIRAVAGRAGRCCH